MVKNQDLYSLYTCRSVNINRGGVYVFIEPN